MLALPFRILVLISIFMHMAGSEITLIQVTDLHIPSSNHPGYRNMVMFNHSVLKVVNPDAVLVSGDMVLGYKWKLISRNQIHQWELYESLWKLQESVPQSLWLDLPGNHDFAMDRNDISNHSSQGCTSRIRLYPISEDKEDICLLGVDFSYFPHVPYWLNLYGYGTNSILSSIREAFSSRSCSVSIAYSHFPLGLLNTHAVASTLKHVGVSLFLSGHLHGTDLHYITEEGVIDMQLPSLAYNGVFRLIVVDHGWISLIDEEVSAMELRPLVMFINPPRMDINLHRSVMQWKEYIHQNHIAKVKLIEMKFDGFTLQPLQLPHSTTPINALHNEEYCWEWNPESFSPSVHQFVVIVSFANLSGTYTIKQDFSVDLSGKSIFQSQHTFHLLKMKWIEPSFAVVLLVGFLAILLFTKRSLHSYEVLYTQSSYSLRSRFFRVISIPILYDVFRISVISLLCGIYFIGRMEQSFFIAFAWGVLTYSTEKGWEYSFWTELVIWGAIALVTIVLPIVLFCMVRIQKSKRRTSSVYVLPLSVAIVSCFVQYVLLFFNFPFHVCILSVNLFILPLAVIFIPFCFFNNNICIVC